MNKGRVIFESVTWILLAIVAFGVIQLYWQEIGKIWAIIITILVAIMLGLWGLHIGLLIKEPDYNNKH
jgi:hypothetical protein